MTKAPVMPACPFTGCMLPMAREPIAFLERARALGDVVRLPFPFAPPIFSLATPALAEEVLVTKQRIYSKGTRGYATVRKVLGNGLLTSEGSFWLRQRRIANPAFHKDRLAAFAGVMQRCTDEAIAAWPSDGRVDVQDEMARLTLRIAGLTLLSRDLAGAADHIGVALTELLQQLLHRSVGLELPAFLPTATNRRFVAAKRALDETVSSIIAARRASAAAESTDLLGLLMNARDTETGEAMDDAQLRDEVLTLFLAGYETSASALSWTFALLAHHPDVLARAREEVLQCTGGAPPTLAQLASMPLLDAILDEALRLYPPVWLLTRRAEEDDVLAGVHIPRGSFVFLSPAVVQRDPRAWERPNGFDPSRFLSGAPARAAWLPFSLGPRKCIGEGFARMELRIILASVLRAFDIAPLSDRMPEPDAGITLRPRGGVHVAVRARALGLASLPRSAVAAPTTAHAATARCPFAFT